MAKEKETPEDRKSSKSKAFLFGIPLLVLLIAGGAAAAYFIGAFNGSKPAEAGASQEMEKPKETLGPLLDMEDMVVNIMNKDTTHFLKIGITLEAKDEESSGRIRSRMPQITDAVLLLAGNKDFDEIRDLQGKLQLKADLMARINSLLGAEELNDIFFTNFVVQ